MGIDLVLAPKQKRPAGAPCWEPVVYPDVERTRGPAHGVRREGARRRDPPAAGRRAAQARRQGLRLRARGALRPPQPTVSHHLKVLREAGIIDCERRRLWAYSYVIPGALEELSAWLS